MEENNTSRFIPYDLIQKELDGTISEREGVLLGRWISEDVENHELYNEVKSIADDLVVLECYKKVDTGSQWEKFKHQLDKTEDDQKPEIATAVRTIWKPWMKFVAAAVLFVIGFAVYLNFDRWMGYEVRLYGSVAQQPTILPDGSIMTLQAGADRKSVV